MRRTLAGFLAAPDSPTADLYFMNACGDFLSSGLRRLGPTVFASPRACLVMRHDLRAEGLAAAMRGRRLVYFVDDAVEEGTGDAALPFLYRQKLRLVERAAQRRIAPRQAAVVVSSPALARRHGGLAETHLVDPYWSEPMAGTGHFAPMAEGAGWIEIACLGSSVHRRDLAFLWPVIGNVLAAHPRARLHLSERHRLPAWLRGHPRIRPIAARGWSVYRAALRGRRFHLALYPLLDTPFNRARSINKLIEHGVVGAAPLYSRCWPEAGRAVAAGAGLALAPDPDAWRIAIEQLITRPARMRALAEGAIRLAGQLNRPGPQRRLWAELMEVGLDAAA